MVHVVSRNCSCQVVTPAGISGSDWSQQQGDVTGRDDLRHYRGSCDEWDGEAERGYGMYSLRDIVSVVWIFLDGDQTVME